MTDSAPSARDRRRVDTWRALTRAARQATAENGLSGFTVEDLCETVGVSRRTFFNYFASKEDAVLGVPLERGDDEAVARFVAGGTASGALSPTLLVDLAALAEARWRVLDFAPDTVRSLLDAVEREPRLLARLLDRAVKDEQADAALVARREGLAAGDLRAVVAAQVVGAICRGAGGEFLAPGNTASFTDIFERRIGAAAALFVSQQPLPAASAPLESETP